MAETRALASRLSGAMDDYLKKRRGKEHRNSARMRLVVNELRHRASDAVTPDEHGNLLALASMLSGSIDELENRNAKGHRKEEALETIRKVAYALAMWKRSPPVTPTKSQVRKEINEMCEERRANPMR